MNKEVLKLGETPLLNSYEIVGDTVFELACSNGQGRKCRKVSAQQIEIVKLYIIGTMEASTGSEQIGEPHPWENYAGNGSHCKSGVHQLCLDIPAQASCSSAESQLQGSPNFTTELS